MSDGEVAQLRWSDQARVASGRRWEDQHRHPALLGIADGTLPLERLEVWVRQDFVFLVAYSRVLGYAVARAPDLATMAVFADVVRATLHDAMALHRTYAAEFGITEAQLEAEQPSRETAAYVDFLLRHAAAGTFEDLVAALLPCMWVLTDVGRRMAAEGVAPADERFRRWIALYADEDFARLAAWCRRIADRAAERSDPAGRTRMTRIFSRALEHELAFWDQVLPRAGG